VFCFAVGLSFAWGILHGSRHAHFDGLFFVACAQAETPRSAWVLVPGECQPFAYASGAVRVLFAPAQPLPPESRFVVAVTLLDPPADAKATLLFKDGAVGAAAAKQSTLAARTETKEAAASDLKSGSSSAGKGAATSLSPGKAAATSVAPFLVGDRGRSFGNEYRAFQRFGAAWEPGCDEREPFPRFSALWDCCPPAAVCVCWPVRRCALFARGAQSFSTKVRPCVSAGNSVVWSYLNCTKRDEVRKDEVRSQPAIARVARQDAFACCDWIWPAYCLPIAPNPTGARVGLLCVQDEGTLREMLTTFWHFDTDSGATGSGSAETAAAAAQAKSGAAAGASAAALSADVGDAKGS
jgi:hypothetical protein